MADIIEGLRNQSGLTKDKRIQLATNISARKNNNIHRNDRYLTYVQYHEMPATINVRYLTRYML